MSSGNNEPIVRIGVLADTHIPDRAKELHPDIIPIFQQHKVDRIIHAGDICVPSVLEQLAEVAPVNAVRGNRDLWRLKTLLPLKEIEINGIRILITHGHGHFFSYLWDKLPYWLLGYRLEPYIRKFSRLGINFDIVIFGHSHRPEKRWVDGRLFFNPGSAYDRLQNQQGPSIGLIEIGPRKEIDPQIIRLRELTWKWGKWVE